MTGNMPFVERAFDLNDWFLLSCIAVTFALVYFLPRRFSCSVTVLLFLLGSTAACVSDNSIGGHIFDLYDIMDGPKFTVMDFTAYLLYAPFGYFFIYFYDLSRLSGMKTVVYIAVLSLLSVLFEWVCVQVGIFSYKDGYSIYYSFCVYLFVQTGTLLFYHFIADQRTRTDPNPR